MQLENLVTVKEAAQLAGVSKVTIYSWLRNGTLGCIRKGSFRLIDKSSLLAIASAKARTYTGGRPKKIE